MTKTQSGEELLAAHGWEIECSSPFEIRHQADGSFATGNAALRVVESLRREEQDETVARPGRDDGPISQYLSTAIKSQSVVFEQLYEVGPDGSKVRIRIESDSFPEQSSARAEVFSEASKCWNPLTSVSYSLMKTPHKLYVLAKSRRQDEFILAFEADRDALLDQACIILGAARR